MCLIRPYRAEDLSALYAISLATGDAGGDAAHLYRDKRMMGHIYSAPYARLNAKLVRVAVDEQGVAGFVLGAYDTAAWEARLEQSWWPKLRAVYDNPDPARFESWGADERRAAMIHAPALTPPAIAEAYPAHLHLNLLSRVQGKGLGSKLLDTWLRLAARQGSGSVHVAVNRANRRATDFWLRHGFHPLVASEIEAGRTVWMGRP